MNRLQRTLLTCLIAGSSFQIFAQQLSLFTQYRENQSIINPAAVNGSYLTHQQNLSFGASYRAQWAGLENAPTTATLRGEYLYTGGGSVSLIAGGYLVNDQTGPTGFTGIYGRIGGLLSSDPEYAGISIGLSAGAVQYRVNTSEIRLRDEGDILSGADIDGALPPEA
ncbi:MAG: type IX secretion system membrane protein PorP/SprF, partial [Bacteroidota bacterium]